ncbi:hypothetical protein VNO77_23646 [Canavalia gladiata]|uniref:Uncharacterized protein n=1 Tax=Canavalia gladiata TaxID=3824 RepID=A0AAN9QBW6_CANGL
MLLVNSSLGSDPRPGQPRRAEIPIYDIAIRDVIPLNVGDQVVDGSGTRLVTDASINTKWGFLMASISEDTGKDLAAEIPDSLTTINEGIPNAVIPILRTRLRAVRISYDSRTGIGLIMEGLNWDDTVSVGQVESNSRNSSLDLNQEPQQDHRSIYAVTSILFSNKQVETGKSPGARGSQSKPYSVFCLVSATGSVCNFSYYNFSFSRPLRSRLVAKEIGNAATGYNCQY